MFDLADFSKYRSQLMGFAAILILLCHSWYCIDFPASVKYIIVSCNVGVDVFLLLSGIGLFFSLEKRKSSLKKWYSHRFLRIGIPFLVLIGLEYLFAWYLGEVSFVRFFFTMTTLGYWFYHDGAWFVSLLVPLYFLSPLLYSIRKCKHGVFYLTLLLILFVVVGKIDAPHNNSCFLYNFTFALQKCPSFIIGLIFAPWVVEGRKINFFYLLIAGLLLKFILSRFCGVSGSAAFFVLVIPICLCLCYICQQIESIGLSDRGEKIGKYIGVGLSFMGKISLESYLANSFLLHIALSISIPINGCNIYLLIIIIGTIISIYVRKVSLLLLKQIEKK